ncbi:ribosomal protein S6 kinase 2 beta-like [Periophthalmus magnuspinnatus]|uniref:ribosomal protein S6 kinase 2 beta-like n=1 Tax=Periophthalmus magnuspinnatus TaxID=409849 RepID=UPI00145A0AD3|nr:ribosomal protein S6 kinase 2 beta-like [Periophthalmus magnuspinnatus]
MPYSQSHSAETHRMEPVLSLDDIRRSIPRHYEAIQTVSSGGFGQVVKCRKRDTEEFVAVKLPFYMQDTEKEVSILHLMMDEGMDKKNIVKFYEEFDTPLGKGQVFEMLDMNLMDFYDTQHLRLPLSDVRSIVKQVATALDVLKTYAIIHADLKLENIMVCDRAQRPIQVKLIDFGMALYASKAEQGLIFHHVCYRAPEVILGCLFDEAVDVWCLGTMMATLLFGFQLFPDTCEYDVMRVIIKLLGAPSGVYLDRGMFTNDFFIEEGRSWKFMTNEEMFGFEREEYVTAEFGSLHEIVKTHYKLSDMEELDAPTVLLRQMLEPDAAVRITPAEILQHPFICGQSGESVVRRTSPEVIMVRPARPENTYTLEEDEQQSDSVISGSVDIPFFDSEDVESGSVTSEESEMTPEPRVMKGSSENAALQETHRMEPVLSLDDIRRSIPRHYEAIQTVSSGGFGQVVKCRKRDTEEFVAVKLPFYMQDTEKEVSILHLMMDEGMDKKNIVKFYEEFDTPLGKGQVFEMLDMNLMDFYDTQHLRLPLSDVRSIVKQVATALDVLKTYAIIHADLKLENIMVCDRAQRPIQVKLIDFGMALYASKAEQGLIFHHVCYRAPEVILGCLFDEAVDVWCLGTMMATLLFGFQLFPDTCEYDVMRVIIKLLGAPSGVYLDRGMFTNDFFIEEGRSWKFMTNEEMFGFEREEYVTAEFGSLHEIVKTHYKLSDMEELDAPTVLLRQMLEPDAAVRITPAEILQHPFICGQSGESVVRRTSPEVIMVRPARPENTYTLEEDEQQSDSVISGSVDIPFFDSEDVESGSVTSEESEMTPEPRVMKGSSENAALQEVGNQRRKRWKNKVSPLCTGPPTSSRPAWPEKKSRLQKIFAWFKRLNCFSSRTEE